MKNILLIPFLGIPILFAQEKSKILSKSETITISNLNDDIQVNTAVQEQRFIVKSKNINDYNFSVPFDSFSEVLKIDGESSKFNKKKNKYLATGGVYVSTHPAIQHDIFHSDLQYKHISFTNVVDSTKIDLRYEKKYKNPRLLSLFTFQDSYFIDNTELKIVYDPTIEMGYKLFGANTDKITFHETTENGKKVLTWKASNIPHFEEEDNMNSPIYYIPHVIFYVKSYHKEGKPVTYLNTAKELYEWYANIIKDANKRDQSQIKATVATLLQNIKNDEEKAQVIFNWVQKNLHYVAFEYGMGGFIPRDAVDVFEKKYGDCKDMANLTNEMLKAAKLNSSLTWIGTRSKPYSYSDLPTPLVDNHMIASVEINKKRYYLDATDKFCPFTYPSSMIQGKEALIGKNNTDFTIEKVQIVPAEQNKKSFKIDYKIEQNALKGKAEVAVNGLSKSHFANLLAAYPNKEEEIVKSLFTNTNERISLEIMDKNLANYENKPALVTFNFSVDNGIKKSADKIILKPFLVFPYKDGSIDLDQRKYGLELENLTNFEMEYKITLEENMKIDFLPQTTVFSNEVGFIEMKYAIHENQIIINQKSHTKMLDIEVKKLPLWNEFVKICNKMYNQSIVLKNE
jgi:hypothetical protein